MSSAQEIVRHIGIDFGTSTSAVCYRDYLPDGKPATVGEPEPVRFGPFSETVSTLVLVDPAGNASFGEEARRKAEEHPELLRSGFKMDLIKTQDPERAERAGELTRRFLDYLHERYRHHATTVQDIRIREERTFVSYPAKWPAPIREMMVEAARQAGFENVEGMTEPEAAMRYFSAVRTREYQELEEHGIIVEGEPMKVLLADMGAGTTDLVLYRYVPGGTEHSVLAVWPPVDVAEKGANLGGREIDERLFERVISPALPDGLLDELPARYVADFRAAVKPWKEGAISPTLAEGTSVSGLPSAIATPLAMMRKDAKLSLDREHFEDLFEDYLTRFAELVEELVGHATELGRIGGGEDVDLVVLTGGHSQWYWAREILSGKMDRFGGTALGKIQAEPERVLTGPKPEQTVARGMAMTGGPAPGVAGVVRPVHIERAAANSVWLKLTLGETDLEPLQVQKIGDRLPRSEQVLLPVQWTFRSVEERMPGSCTLVAGETLKGGKTFDPTDFGVPYKGFVKRLVQYLTPEDNGHVYLDVRVDENEHYTVLGLVRSSWSGGYGHFAINRPSPNDRERRALFEDFQRQVAENS